MGSDNNLGIISIFHIPDELCDAMPQVFMALESLSLITTLVINGMCRHSVPLVTDTLHLDQTWNIHIDKDFLPETGIGAPVHSRNASRPVGYSLLRFFIVLQ